MKHSPLHLATFTLVAALWAGCGSGGEEAPAAPRIDPEQAARLEQAMHSLETASKRVRGEVLRTCDKWRHIDTECVEEEIRIVQLECWLEAGLARWQSAQKRGLGPYSGDRVTMMVHNLCVEQRRYRKTEKWKF